MIIIWDMLTLLQRGQKQYKPDSANILGETLHFGTYYIEVSKYSNEHALLCSPARALLSTYRKSMEQDEGQD